jgi:hypothetical protein
MSKDVCEGMTEKGMEGEERGMEEPVDGWRIVARSMRFKGDRAASQASLIRCIGELVRCGGESGRRAQCLA